MPLLPQHPQKKRRHDDFDTSAQYHVLYDQLHSKPSAAPLSDKLNISSQDIHNDLYPQRHGTPPRNITSISSPRAKKLRMMTEQPDSEEVPCSFHAHPQTAPRPNPLAPSSRHNHTRSLSASKLAARTAINTNMLAPCHVCRRKPTKKTELDSYAECQGCGERTCYICMRECLGWGTTPQDTPNLGEEVLMRDDEANCGAGERETGNAHAFNMQDAPREDALDHHPGPRAQHRIREGTWVKEGGTGHRGRICSQCCVEKGLEGEVTCLGCLEA